jgi:hypothetical protein
MKITFFSLIFTLFSVNSFAASGFKDEGTPTEINVEVGKVTEVVFPQKVAKVIKGGLPDAILIEVLDSSVYLLPKAVNPPQIFVTTLSGVSYPLNLHISKEHDIKVQVGIFHKSSQAVGIYSDVMDFHDNICFCA